MSSTHEPRHDDAAVTTTPTCDAVLAITDGSADPHTTVDTPLFYDCARNVAPPTTGEPATPTIAARWFTPAEPQTSPTPEPPATGQHHLSTDDPCAAPKPATALPAETDHDSGQDQPIEALSGLAGNLAPDLPPATDIAEPGDHAIPDEPPGIP